MNGSSPKNVAKERTTSMSSLSKLYLIGYNGLQTAGWSYIFVQCLKFLVQNKSAIGFWEQHSCSILVFQSLAALEVIHAIFGLVSSNAVITAVQVASRLFQVWGIIYSIPEVQNAPAIVITILAWGLTEIVRYSYYTANLVGTKPYFLMWCRYTLFYGLYPMGVFGEVSLILKSLNAIKERQLYSIALPNPANISFSYYYANIFFILTYIPLFPKLFNHMRRQRVKVLGSQVNENVSNKKYM